VLLGLSTGNAVGLAVVAGIFVVFAIVSALVVPRRWPDFPGRHLRWFIVVTLVLFVATLAAVEVFAKEPKEESAVGETTTEPAPTTTQAAQPPPGPAGDAAAGKSVFNSLGCGSCHTFSAAGSSGAVGPNLDEALQGKDAAFVEESIVDPNKEIAPGYQANVMPDNFGDTLTPKQVSDLVAFLQSG
jgi:mono/diheme cytochrome c family protein